MLKRFDGRLWTMGAMVPMILAGCATSSPTSTPASQAARASYTAQGGAAAPEAAPQLGAAPSPCGECPASVGLGVTPFALMNFQQLSANPILDYSWYYARGNFATFGWAPGFYAQLQNFMWYPTASGYWPYAYNVGAGAYMPYSTIYGGRAVYPYLGLGGGMLGSYAGLERRMERRRERREGDMGQGQEQAPSQGQAPSMGQGQGQAPSQGQSGSY